MEVRVRKSNGRGRGSPQTPQTRLLRLRESKIVEQLRKWGNRSAARGGMEQGAWETGRLQRKKRGGVGDKSRPGKGAEAGRKAGTRMRAGRGGAEVSGVAESEWGKNSRGRQGPKQRGAPRYLQRSSRTLPGISTRLVSMMRTHSRSSASRLRAAGGRRYCRKTPAPRRTRSGGGGGGSYGNGRGKGRDRSPSSGSRGPGPRGWAEAGGGVPRATPLLCLKDPMGRWGTGTLAS